MSRYRTNPSFLELVAGTIGTLVWRCASALPARLRWTLGRSLGIALYAFASNRRFIVRRNLELCFPNYDAEFRDRLVVECFRQFGCGILSWGFAIFARSSRIKKEVNWNGKETLDRLLENNVSIIVLCPHFVSALVAMRALGECTPMIAMYQAPMNPVFNVGYKIAFEDYESPLKLISALYRRKCANPIKLQHFRHKPNSVFRGLRQSIPFFYLPDQNAKIDSQRVFAPFFGIEAATYSSLTKFAKFRNSRVLMCCPILLPKSRGYDIHLALLPEDFISGNPQKDAERMNSAIEKLVRDVPEQYFWLHRRFKTRPKGDRSLYRK